MNGKIRPCRTCSCLTLNFHSSFQRKTPKVERGCLIPTEFALPCFALREITVRITALSLLFLFVALQAFGTQPELRRRSYFNLCGPTFNALVPGQKVEIAAQSTTFLSQSSRCGCLERAAYWSTRILAGIRPESETIKRLRQTHGEAVEDESVNTSLVGNHRTLGIHEIGKRSMTALSRSR